MRDEMMTFDEKIKKLKNESETQLKADIADYEMLLGDNQVIQSVFDNVKKEFKNINPHAVYELGYYNIDNLSIVDIDSKVNYKDGIDYRLDKTWGMVEVLQNSTIKKDVNIVVSFDVKECIYESMDGGIAFIKHKGKNRDEIIALKKEAEAKLNDSYKMYPVGYPYFNDVSYINLENFDYIKQDKTLKGFDFDKTFNTVNYLAYLYWYIKRLNTTQENVKRIRAIAPPAKEIILILEYIDSEDDAIEPLIKLLATFEGDYSSKIISHNNRIAYKVEKETAQPTTHPKLNIDKLSTLKIEYKEKIKELYTMMRKQNNRKYKLPTETLLNTLNLPLRPSEF